MTKFVKILQNKPLHYRYRYLYKVIQTIGMFYDLVNMLSTFLYKPTVRSGSGQTFRIPTDPDLHFLSVIEEEGHA